MTADSAAPDISFIVLSFNSARYIEKCVRSIARAAKRSEIWVVENGSRDASPDILTALEAELCQLRVIRVPSNLGTTRSRNLALRQARGRYIAIIDSDVEIPAGTIDVLRQTLDADPRHGIVAPRLVFPDGRQQLSTDVFPTVQRKLRRFFLLRRIESTMSPAKDPEPVDYAISAFWLMRRETLQQVGFLDERIFYSPEDVDYCLRVWQAGLRVVFEPRVAAIHDAQEISRSWMPKRATLSHAFGLVYLFFKHRYAFSLRRTYRRHRLAASAAL